jgi:hypothetical protein
VGSDKKPVFWRHNQDRAHYSQPGQQWLPGGFLSRLELSSREKRPWGKPAGEVVYPQRQVPSTTDAAFPHTNKMTKRNHSNCFFKCRCFGFDGKK